MQITLEDVIRLTYGTNGVYHLESTYNLDKILKENNYLKCVKPAIRSLAHFNNQTEWIANPCKCLEASNIPDYKSACEIISKLKEEVKDVTCESIRIRKLDMKSEEVANYFSDTDRKHFENDSLHLVEAVLPDKTIWLHTINWLYGDIWVYQNCPRYTFFLPLNIACCIYDKFEVYINDNR